MGPPEDEIYEGDQATTILERNEDVNEAYSETRKKMLKKENDLKIMLTNFNKKDIDINLVLDCIEIILTNPKYHDQSRMFYLMSIYNSATLDEKEPKQNVLYL